MSIGFGGRTIENIIGVGMKNKSGRGLPQSKTLARGRKAMGNGEAFGLRQSSAALIVPNALLHQPADGAVGCFNRSLQPRTAIWMTWAASGVSKRSTIF